MDKSISTASAAEYRLLETGAVALDRSSRARWRFKGEKAAEVLTGLVTNDILALRPGEGAYAAALTAKGKIIADVRVFSLDDSFLVDTSAAAAEGWSATVRKFVNPRVAPYQDVTGETCDIFIFGRGAADALAQLTGFDAGAIDQMPRYSHVVASDVTIVRAADTGDVPGYDLLASRARGPEQLAGLLGLGVAPASDDALELARIEAGRPAWGIDMDDSTLAQEANLDELDAISFSKGCYVGQEVVARLHFRGHVNKYLRRIAFESAADGAPGRGAELKDESGKIVGDLRSVAISPVSGGVGIAMIRREVPAGATLTASWSGKSGEIKVLNEKGATK